MENLKSLQNHIDVDQLKLGFLFAYARERDRSKKLNDERGVGMENSKGENPQEMVDFLAKTTIQISSYAREKSPDREGFK